MDIQRIFRGPIVWIGVAILVALLAGQFISSASAPKKVDTSAIIASITKGDAKSAVPQAVNGVLVLTEKTADGKSVILDVMVGTGDANYKGLLAELKKAKWGGVMAIETDNGTYSKEPSEFVAGAIKFVKDNAK
jgi:hypothetical protein